MPTTTQDIDLGELSAGRGGSQPLRGYLARPSQDAHGPGPWPGVVVVHEAFGLDEQAKGQTERLAAAGFLTLAVDLFSAGGVRRCLVSTIRALNRGEGRAFTDIGTGREWLGRSPDQAGGIGVIGFCLGGGFALLTAAGYGFDAASVNYGFPPKDLDARIAGACPVVASYGGRDRPLRGAAATLETALTGAGIVHDVKEYPGAGHSFLNSAPNGPRVLRPLLRVAGIGPDPAAADEAWRRIETFFHAHLEGGS
ncbi:dienelactone hydrolase family protein [Streptomyces sp. NPDC058470]|uniref:dienelactone hydrolase family protein n=1 Tax=Streptomyces sp. NPDC058470 TaxID=3346515 RepID=UPI0036626A42